MQLGQILHMLVNEPNQAAVSHIIIDPGKKILIILIFLFDELTFYFCDIVCANLVLQEEQIMYLAYYRHVAY